MAARQQVGVVEIRDGASAGDVHIAAYQNCADRRPGNQRFRLLVIANRTRPHDRYNTDRGKILREEPQRVFAEAGEDQRSVDGLQQVCVAWVRLIRRWSISPTKSRLAFGGRARSRFAMSVTSTIEVSSTTRRSQSRGFASFRPKLPVTGWTSSRRWMVLASTPVGSDRRLAALPVGAHRRQRTFLARRISRMALTSVVLPTPGPPVMTSTRF